MMGQGRGGLILVTGANGYIASRLIPRLLEQGRTVRALVRDPLHLTGRTWADQVKVVAGDTRDPVSLASALEGVDTAYYLIHSMSSGRGYIAVERESARRFAAAAEGAAVQHIIYLGGLADPHAKNIASHMRSRIETGEILRQGSVPVTEFRAGVIVGPGSISFEMIRFLTEFFPILPGPTWLHNKVQPIAASNVIDYLAAALEHPEARGGIYEMGGPDQMPYANTMLEYARRRGLKRWLVMLPGIPIWLMAWLVDRLTPVPYAIATPLVEGLRSDSIVRDEAARRAFPEIELVSYRDALQAALADLAPEKLERVWEGFHKDAVRLRHEGFFIDHRRKQVSASAERVFGVLSRPEGRNGRPNPEAASGRADVSAQEEARSNLAAGEPALKAGDKVDGCTVEAITPGQFIRLRSDRKSAGDGWMEWRIETCSQDRSILTQTAFFAPRGLPGLLYWMALDPFRRLVYRGHVREVQKRSER